MGIEGRLAGSAGEACSSRSQGFKFEPHAGCRGYLKKVFEKKWA